MKDKICRTCSTKGDNEEEEEQKKNASKIFVGKPEEEITAKTKGRWVGDNKIDLI
jgi:hypothetical protein